MQGNDQIKALQTLIESPEVSEQDKIAHEATIEGLKSNIAQQWMAYHDVTNDDGTVLNNRPIEEIDKDIQKVDEQIASENGDKSQLEYQKKVLAVERHIAEQLKLPEFEKLAKQLDKNVATDGVNTQGKQIVAHETLANKIYNGASDESGVKRGMLEYARILLNPNIPEEAKQGVIGEMNKFLNSQDRKETAIKAAKKEYYEKGKVEPIHKPYGMYADGRTAEVEYRGAQTEGLVNSIVAENTLMKSIRDQIMNEGQTTTPVDGGGKQKLKEQFRGKIILAHAGIGKSYTANKTKGVIDGDHLFTQAANAVVEKYNKENNEAVKTIPTVKDMKSVFTAWGEYSKDPVKVKEAKKRREEVYQLYTKLAVDERNKGNTVLISSARDPLAKVADMAIIQDDTGLLKKSIQSPLRENQNSITDESKINDKVEKLKEVAKDNQLATVSLKPGQYLGDLIIEGQTDEQSNATDGQNEPVQAGTESSTKTEEGSRAIVGQNEKGGSIREETPTNQIDELPPEDTTQLSDKEKLLEGIDDWRIKAAQTENITDTEIVKRKAVLGKLVDKLYADHWKEDPKAVKDKIDELVGYKGDIAPDNVVWLKKLIEAKAEVKQAEKQLEDSKNETVRLQAELDSTAKMIVDRLLRKIEPITKDYKARYAGTTAELTAKTKEANKQAKDCLL